MHAGLHRRTFGGLTDKPPIPASAPAAGLLPLAGRLRLRAAIFLAGASVMILQVLGTRIIGPHYGVGLYVWTSLIAVTLLALAGGYWVGGLAADRHPSPAWLAAVLFAAAACVLLVIPLRALVIEFGWRFGLRGGALFSAIVLFLPAFMLLGMVSPFAVRLEARGVDSAGSSAGRLYAISTAGSVAGAVAAGFYLVPSFRVPVLLTLTAAVLIAAALLVAPAPRRGRFVAVGVVLAAAALAVARPGQKPAALLAVAGHESSDVRVVEFEGRRFLMVDQAAQSAIDRGGRPAMEYAYFLAAHVMMARPAARTAAVVGLGGGTMIPLLEQAGLKVDAVEIAPEVIRLARTYFRLGSAGERVHEADGRVFLAGHCGAFDVVVLDAFAGDRMAYTLVSREGLAVAKRALTPGGLLVLNTWGLDPQGGGPNRVGAAVRQTLGEVFHHVLAVPVAGNLIFLASDEPVEPRRGAVVLETFDGPRECGWAAVTEPVWPEAFVLSDDWNPVDTLDARGLEATRQAQRESLPDAVREALVWE